MSADEREVVRAAEHDLAVLKEYAATLAVGPTPALVSRAQQALLEAADRAWDMQLDEGEYDAHPGAR